MSTSHRHTKTVNGHQTVTPTYKTWLSMLARCRSKTGSMGEKYGLRGVTVCERWLRFENFLENMGERPAGKTIDRIKNELGYEPGNCRWATGIEQGRNKSNNVNLTWQGKTMCLSAWAEELGISGWQLRNRFRRGWTVDRMFGTPFRTNRMAA
jgi:hypothetical protein